MLGLKMLAALGAASVALVSIAAPAQAQTKLKWAHVYEVTEPYHTQAVWAAGEIKKRTNGRYDIEVFPTYATIAKGHRIRITLSTADSPHLVPTLPALAKLTGGVYQVQLGTSAVELPLVPAS